MTCIAGVAHRGKVWLGGDSAEVIDSRITQIADPKVWIKGHVVLGFAGDTRLSQEVRHRFWPPFPPTGDLMWCQRYMLEKFGPALKPYLPENSLDWELIVGVRGHLFVMNPDMSSTCSIEGYDAVGTGALAARVAISCTSKGDYPRRRLLFGLRKAEEFRMDVRRPFHVVVA